MTADGKPSKRPRTKSHVPMAQPGPDARTPPGPIAGASGPVEAVAGLVGGRGRR